MSLSLRSLRYFVAAAETGSVTAAALASRVSQPSVSESLTQLEADLRVQLFVRHHGRGLTLTAAGDRLLVQARNLLAHAADVEKFAADMGSRTTGEVRVGCFVTLAPYVLPALLGDIANAYPQLTVQHEEDNQEELLERLRSGRLDLAVSYAYAISEEFEVEVLAELPPHVVLAAEHPFARRRSISLKEVAGMPMVLLDLPLTRDYFLSLFRSVRVEPNIVHRTRSYEMVRAMVARGHGFSVLNAIPRNATSYEGRKIVAVPIAETLPRTLVVCLRSKRVAPRPSVELFRERVKAFFATEWPKLMQTRRTRRRD